MGAVQLTDALSVEREYRKLIKLDIVGGDDQTYVVVRQTCSYVFAMSLAEVGRLTPSASD